MKNEKFQPKAGLPLAEKMKKLIFTLSLLVGVVLAVPADAFADIAKNINTGPGSTNIAIVKDRKVFDHMEFKLGRVRNVSIIDENTGGNVVDDNTVGPNSVGSGKAEANIESEDYVNFSSIDVGQSSSDGDTAVNNTTGSGSTNVAKVKKTRVASYSGMSMGRVRNLSVVSLNTGDNSVSGNTVGSNTVTSGDADVDVDHASDVNSTVVIVRQ